MTILHKVSSDKQEDELSSQNQPKYTNRFLLIAKMDFVNVLHSMTNVSNRLVQFQYYMTVPATIIQADFLLIAKMIL